MHDNLKEMLNTMLREGKMGEIRRLAQSERDRREIREICRGLNRELEINGHGENWKNKEE